MSIGVVGEHTNAFGGCVNGCTWRLKAAVQNHRQSFLHLIHCCCICLSNPKLPCLMSASLLWGSPYLCLLRLELHVASLPAQHRCGVCFQGSKLQLSSLQIMFLDRWISSQSWSWLFGMGSGKWNSSLLVSKRSGLSPQGCAHPLLYTLPKAFGTKWLVLYF